MRGWLICNGSLNSKKFHETHHRYIEMAKSLGITLTVKTNSEVGILLSNQHIALVSINTLDFVLFLDKDVLLAKQLEACGLPVFNSSQSIEACDNKGLMHHLLALKGIKQPKTLIAPLIFDTESPFPKHFLNYVEETLHFPVVVKKSYGSFGMGVYLIHDRQALEDISERLKLEPHIYQQYIKESHGKDMRIHVVGDKVVASMMRKSATDFRANVTNGGEMLIVDVPERFKTSAIAASVALGLDFSGVDLLFGANDEPIICEVNSNAHIENIFKATDIDVSETILKHIIEKLT
ncbi:hypothetical protein GCM10012290_14920 [Halolactibacillus alkaliphilus]|uniref:ATP-grasp domain-containing protein n=1 Tax=Halolactibacillus alkaliphilus TaxID=442899 RepID=A0A511X1E8_9BACI|nr:RimK family alpha-L-glutamate ligase [Halolactibacillus alkaliphilus]GEN56768.1 hypothetical protein HAL01_12320 [Halolactibacillus alkaliphilus]GGN70780.1 hypothetical protein GCM10012290_14920 [Halolactibacillus alkaliphilus]SFO79697.1 gamma-F420-2:alpha-L-glutamate ligase [Halolactibacillus alkaliphilus]